MGSDAMVHISISELSTMPAMVVKSGSISDIVLMLGRAAFFRPSVIGAVA
jgi:hypothetical protein